MKFINISVINKTGDSEDMPVNPEHVSMLMKAQIPSGLTSSDGKTPMLKEGTAISLSNGAVLLCSLDREKVQELLEEKQP